MFRMLRLARWAALFVAALSSASPAGALLTLGELHGAVTDESGGGLDEGAGHGDPNRRHRPPDHVDDERRNLCARGASVGPLSHRG